MPVRLGFGYFALHWRLAYICLSPSDVVSNQAPSGWLTLKVVMERALPLRSQ